MVTAIIFCKDIPNLSLMDKSRFWKKVDKLKENECWMWLGAKNKEGYGRFKMNGKLYGTNRISYKLKFGKLGNNLWVLHKCDNPPCVNPDHLFLGTRKDNMQDAFHKGRIKTLNFSPKKLNEIKVKEIRLLINKKVSLREIARRYNLHHNTVSEIRDNKIWKQSNMTLKK